MITAKTAIYNMSNVISLICVFVCCMPVFIVYNFFYHYQTMYFSGVYPLKSGGRVMVR